MINPIASHKYAPPPARLAFVQRDDTAAPFYSMAAVDLKLPTWAEVYRVGRCRPITGNNHQIGTYDV